MGIPGSQQRASSASALQLAHGDGTVLAEPVGRALASGLDEACRLELRSLASSGALNSPSLFQLLLLIAKLILLCLEFRERTTVS